MKKVKLTESQLVELIEYSVKKMSVKESINEKYKTWDIDFDGRKIRKNFRNEMDENSVKMWCERYFEKTPKMVSGVSENINEDIDLMWSKLPLEKDKTVNEYFQDINKIVKNTDDIVVKKQGLDLLKKLDSMGDTESIKSKEFEKFVDDNKSILNEQPEILEPEVAPDIETEPIQPKRIDPRKKPFEKPEHIEPDSEPTPAKALIENKIKLSKSELERQGIKYNPDCKYYKKGDFIYKVRNDGNYTCYKGGKVHNLGKNFNKEVNESNSKHSLETDLKIYQSELNMLNKIKSTGEKHLKRKEELEKKISDLSKQLNENYTNYSIIGKKVGEIFKDIPGINMISDKVITYVKVFENDEEFSAYSKSSEHLKNEGYDKGSMYMNYPIPFMEKGKTGISNSGDTMIITKHGEQRPLVITKYDRLNSDNWNEMDGVLLSKNFRYDDVFIVFFNFPQ
jgi:hypothetical protein